MAAGWAGLRRGVSCGVSRGVSRGADRLRSGGAVAGRLVRDLLGRGTALAQLARRLHL
ncbi:MAG TPA: hypothetical protein VNK43_02655 [Gemmatimonadales bacterium]|nr:hypothetical protein [Gemmatimonadales bacterium]